MSSERDIVVKNRVTIFCLKGGNYWTDEIGLSIDDLLVKIFIQFIHLHLSNNTKLIETVQKRLMKSILNLENLPSSESKEINTVYALAS